jgi:hypothetical protein
MQAAQSVKPFQFAELCVWVVYSITAIENFGTAILAASRNSFDRDL